MTITRRSVVVAAKEQLSAHVNATSAVIAGFRKGRYYGLDKVGARVWELVQQSIAADDIRRTITAEYNVGPEECEADLLSLLEQMEEEGLIEVRS
jgi:hypothetical protein